MSGLVAQPPLRMGWEGVCSAAETDKKEGRSYTIPTYPYTQDIADNALRAPAGLSK